MKPVSDYRRLGTRGISLFQQTTGKVGLTVLVLMQVLALEALSSPVHTTSTTTITTTLSSPPPPPSLPPRSRHSELATLGQPIRAALVLTLLVHYGGKLRGGGKTGPAAGWREHLLSPHLSPSSSSSSSRCDSGACRAHH